jgi:hypothetical protein
MTNRWIRAAAGGLLLGCGGCVVDPAPGPVPMAVQYSACQQFTQPVQSDGKTVMGTGVQCLQPDGSWKIVSPATAAVPAVPPPGGGYAMPYPYPYYYPYPVYGYYPWLYGPDIWIGGGWGPGRGWGHERGWGFRGDGRR